MKNFKIAIDGPAGVGKSTLSKEIADRLSFLYVDSGAMYRAVGLYCLENQIDVSLNQNVSEILDKINISMEYKNKTLKVFLNGEDVSLKIRSSLASTYASKVAVIKEVREKLVEIQRQIAKGQNVLMDGRDIGTKVFPDADVKIFLTASGDARAKRRFLELQSKGDTTSYEEILKEIEFRDLNDSTREVDPLRPASDAIIVDNTNLNFEETVEHVLQIIKGVLK